MSAALFDALDATWPPAASETVGGYRRADGAGGGKRVSATVLTGEFDPADLPDDPLFQVRPGQQALDAALEARGYHVVDPTVLMAAPVATVAEAPRPISLLPMWPSLAIQRALWAEGGIGPERLAVMHRACLPRMGFIARFQNRAAGVGFAAVNRGIAMLHALHVEPAFRRQGVARYMVRGIADWAAQNGADTFALAVTQANAPARALYSALGMAEVSVYHYREKTR